jgi:hypothetical protein
MKYSTQPPLGAEQNLIHPLNRGLVGYWPLSELSGVAVNDLSINNNTGIITNVDQSSLSGWTGSPTGGGVNFDGSNDYIELGNPPALNIKRDITVSAWVKANTNAQYRKIVVKGNALVPIYFFSQGQSTDRTYFGVQNSSNVVRTVVYNVYLPIGRWVHLTGTYDGALIKLYWNGVLVAINTQTGDLRQSAGNVRISGYDNATEFFNGAISQVRIYNRALSASEVALLYADPFCVYKENTYRWLNVFGRKGSFFFSRL